MRPMPADGLPIIGPLPGRRGAYIAVMHSAVTLAASAGRLVAAEVLDARTSESFSTFAPTASPPRHKGVRAWRHEPAGRR